MYENDASRTGKDGNIGLKIPAYFIKLGLIHVECRVSDKVNLLDSHMEHAARESLFRSLQAEGFGQAPVDAEQMISNLIKRGLSTDEARKQYEAELLFSRSFGIDSSFAYAPNMKITFGVVQR